MLRPGDILDNEYSITAVLYEDEAVCMYLAEDASSEDTYIIYAINAADEEEAEKIIDRYKPLKKFRIVGLQRMKDCFMESDDPVVYLILTKPDGMPLREYLISKGPMNRKNAVNMAFELISILKDFKNTKDGRTLKQLSIENINLDDEGHPQLSGIQMSFPLDEVTDEDYISLELDLGILFYQMVTGLANVSRQYYNAQEAASVRLPENCGKQFSKVIRKCLTLGYQSGSSVFTEIYTDLKIAKFFDRFQKSAENPDTEPQSVALQSIDHTERLGNVTLSNNTESPAASSKSDTVRLDLTQEEEKKLVPKDLPGKFEVVRNEMWIHSREIIRGAE